MEGYIQGTEVLTPLGWIDIADVKAETVIAQFNSEREVFFDRAIGFYVNPTFDRQAVCLKGELLEVIMSPDHWVVVYEFADRTLKFKKVGDVVLKEHLFPLTGIHYQEGYRWEDYGFTKGVGGNIIGVSDKVTVNLDGSVVKRFNKPYTGPMFNVLVPSRMFMIRYRRFISVGVSHMRREPS